MSPGNVTVFITIPKLELRENMEVKWVQGLITGCQKTEKRAKHHTYETESKIKNLIGQVKYLAYGESEELRHSLNWILFAGSH